MSIDYMDAGCVMAVTFDDSNISFFDARSMKPMDVLDDINTVTSMRQAGFTFPTDASGMFSAYFNWSFRLTLKVGLHISFSLSGCVAAVLDGDGQMHLRFMEHSFGAEDGLYNDGMLLNRWEYCLEKLNLFFRKIFKRYSGSCYVIRSGLRPRWDV